MNDTPSALGGVPLFPLQTVLFPGSLLPLRIFEARYLDMISTSLRLGRPFGIVPIRLGREVGAPADFFPFGTLAAIESFDKGADGLLHVSVRGSERFRVEQHAVQADQLTVAEVVTVPPAADSDVPRDLAYLASLLEDIFTANADHLPYRELQVTSALWVAYRLAELLPLPAATKVAVLQADDGLAALSRLDAGIQAASSPAPKGTH
jgi:Lon protease-like protein